MKNIGTNAYSLVQICMGLCKLLSAQKSTIFSWNSGTIHRSVAFNTRGLGFKLTHWSFSLKREQTKKEERSLEWPVENYNNFPELWVDISYGKKVLQNWYQDGLAFKQQRMLSFQFCTNFKVCVYCHLGYNVTMYNKLDHRLATPLLPFWYKQHKILLSTSYYLGRYITWDSHHFMSVFAKKLQIVCTQFGRQTGHSLRPFKSNLDRILLTKFQCKTMLQYAILCFKQSDWYFKTFT